MRAISALFLPKFLFSSAKMKAEGIAPSAIGAFENTFNSLLSGNTGMIPESTIDPVPDLIDSASFSSISMNDDDDDDDFEEVVVDDDYTKKLLKSTVVLKLNGGLGTGMGLDHQAKSLLKVKGDDTFLDLTAKQIISMRKEFDCPNIKFMLMNSFSTSEDTLNFLSNKYPNLVLSSKDNKDGLYFEEMIQNKIPKIDATTYEPAVDKTDPSNEWCPPGHGDLYASLEGSGCLDSLLKQGYKYMFVSNSDNLGATLDLSILTYFAKSETPFMMECCVRTENDKKGGHLAVRKVDKQLILRESAMCSKDDEIHFQNIHKYKYFNTNNLWIKLDRLKNIINQNGNGFIPLPMIKNLKTVNPKDDKSQKVIQLETAMGAAIECFKGATAIVVDRTRFAPVKKCNDLLLLRSDAYVIENNKPVLNPNCVDGKAPIMALDSKKYKLVGALEDATKGGIPSLVKCTKLTITGLVTMTSKTKFVGNVTIINNSSTPKRVPTGEVTGTIDLTDVEDDDDDSTNVCPIS